MDYYYSADYDDDADENPGIDSTSVYEYSDGFLDYF